MLPDTRIIHRQGDIEVVAQVHEVPLADASINITHPIKVEGIDSTFYRAFDIGNGCFAIVDLRKLSRTLGEEMLSTAVRDIPGLVLYTLRSHFKRRSELVAAVTALYRFMATPQNNELETDLFGQPVHEAVAA